MERDFSFLQKEFREFFRTADVVLDLLRRNEDGACSPKELLFLRGYVSSLKAHILALETAEHIRESNAHTTPSDTA
jgi:hypothetical protein